jgi:hypothetical protein
VNKETDCYSSFIEIFNTIFLELNVSLLCEYASCSSKSSDFSHVPDLLVSTNIGSDINSDSNSVKETGVFLVEIKKGSLKEAPRAQIVEELKEFMRVYPARFMVIGVLSSLKEFEVYRGFHSGRDTDANTAKVSLLTNSSIKYNWDSDRNGLVKVGCLLSTNYNWYGTICVTLGHCEKLCWNMIKYSYNNNNNNNNLTSLNSSSSSDFPYALLNYFKISGYISSCRRTSQDICQPILSLPYLKDHRSMLLPAPVFS